MKEAGVILFLQVTRIRKIRKKCVANSTRRLLPETGRSQSNAEPCNAKQTELIEIHQSRITNHDLFELVPVNMCFLRGPLRWLTEQKNTKFFRVWMGLTDNWQMGKILTDNWHLPWVLLTTDKGPARPLFSVKQVFKALALLQTFRQTMWSNVRFYG